MQLGNRLLPNCLIQRQAANRERDEKPGEETAQSEPPTIHKTIHKELFATEKAVIEIIQKNPNITRKELAAKLNLSEAGVRYNTDKLQTKGILRRVGGKKAGRWEVIEDRLDAQGGSGVGGGDE